MTAHFWMMAGVVGRVLGTCLLVLLATTSTAAIDLGRQVDFNVQPQALTSAVIDFSRQADVQVLASGPRIEGVSTKGVRGRYSIEQGLKLLLDGTGMGFRVVGEKTISLTPESASPAAQGSTPAGIALAQARSRVSEVADDSGIQKLEPITVTAQKRTELLIDVPQSVTVVTGDELAKRGATQFRDFADTVPGLSFQTQGPGLTQITLRGVTTGLDASSTVGVYVDDVPYGSSTSFARAGQITIDAGLFDLDRIEVLRGPQGTLYGASTMGGLLKYVTNRPDLTRFGGSAQAGISSTAHGGLNHNVAATVNAPISADRAAVRLTGFYTREGGYIDNLALGEKDVNRSDVKGGRANLLFAPTNALTIRLNGFLQDTTLEGFPLADFTLQGVPINGSLDQRRLIAETLDQKFRLVSGTVSYDLGRASLISISSHQTDEARFLNDFSGNFLPILQTIPSTRDRFSAVGSLNRASTDKFTQEVRLASEGSRTLEWLVGGFYTTEESEQNVELSLRDVVGQPAPNGLLTSSIPSQYREYAVFGDLTWRMSEKFDATGGVRYARSRTTFEQVQTGLFGRSAPASRASDRVATYLANARYHFSDRATSYLRYATGYRPGGPNVLLLDPVTGVPVGDPTFEADRLKSYEAGFKAESDGRRLGIDASVYYIDWSDIQVTVVRSGFGARDNAAGGATVRGGELSIVARPTRTFTVAGAFAYQDAKLSEAEPALGAAKGERLPNVPRFTAALNADYELAFGSLKPTIGATVRYVDERKASFDRNTGRPQYDLPDYTSVDLRAGATVGPFTAQVYVRNLFDERGQLIPRLVFYPVSGPAQLSILQPRTIGIAVSAKF
jgi:iron complex outermembrane recepter protein